MALTEPPPAASLPKTYDPGRVEQRIYRFWEEGGYFAPRPNPGRRPFVISMPPPNVTGALHMGHAITMAIEDVMIRYHRMRGDPTLWVPGEDHAGIATQAVVEKQLAKEGLNRHMLGREQFIARVWDWVAVYKKRILDQLRRMGVSCDWTRERFTFDAGLSRAVREVFVRLYEEGLIYRGKRIINWCPGCSSAISDLEVISQNTPGELVYISYPIEPLPGDPPEGREIIVATTRPETMLGDTAVAVNPADERYRDLIGRTATLPLMGRSIPIIADDAVEMGFGTGAVKVTPAHDPTDFAIGLRHDLPQVQVIGFDAKMTAEAGHYAGLDRFEARARVLADLEKTGRIVRREEYAIPLGHCERSDDIIEPLISEQWFVKMAPLATPALNAARYGLIQIVPERFEKVYTDWLTNIRDWNISRQLWWGHRIPAWYCAACGTMTVSREDVTACPHCGSVEVEQDPDVLDTWFSSWLWPFSTLGWPDDTPDLRTFYPTSVLETGYDIIFFWVARMVMAGIHFMGTPPFHTIYLHGIIRDELGRKISKSLGNGLDPVETMDEFGTDALRFTLLTSSTPGNDTKLSVERIKGSRNFVTKIWNAARFILGQTSDFAGPLPDLAAIKPRTLADRWIASRAEALTGEVTRLIEHYNFGEAGRQIYDFFWSDFCDWYLEIAKSQLSGPGRETTAAILRATLDRSLRLLHPVMPFVTEAIWQRLIGSEGFDEPEGALAGQRPALIVAPWPATDALQRNERAEADFDVIRALITRIRDARQQLEVEERRTIPVIIAAGDRARLLRDQSALFETLARTETPKVSAKLAKKPEQAMSLLVEGIEVYLPLAGMIDRDRDLARLDDEIARVSEALARSEALLANEQFISRAKPNVVQAERDKLAGLRDAQAKLETRRRDLQG
jgi:valyl-tRNA synthetase